MNAAVHYTSARTCAEETVARLGKTIVLGLPLGLGKANHLANAFYDLACEDPSLRLTIFTGLTLERPRAKSDLERRLAGPVMERLFSGYPDLHYASDRRRNRVPDNVSVHEFFLSPGTLLSNPDAQQNYTSTNYTHVARDVMAAGINVIAQMVARRTGPDGPRYSLACNPDISLDIVPVLHRQAAEGRPTAMLGEINDNLPFMPNDAEVPADMFDGLYDAGSYTLFGPPAPSVSPTDHAIGMNASTLIKDGGTLQIGIGSLGDAVANALIVRQEDNALYRDVTGRLGAAFSGLEAAETLGGTAPLETGLFGCSEMLFDGFLHLLNAGILKRHVYNHPGLQRALNEGKIDESVSSLTLSALMEQGLIRSRMTKDDVLFLKKFGCIRQDVELEGDMLVSPGGTRVPADLDDPEAREQIGSLCLNRRLGGGTVLEGAFFLGSERFYEGLRDLPEETRALINMTSVTGINDLFGEEGLRRLQRLDARFINSALMATAMGAVVSDGLADGRVISGVGGQYNFVAMAHELEGGRAVLALRSTRTKDGEVTSNIVWNYGHTTIPRHLRDIIVTEYGIADLRGQPDHEVIARMLNICDSRFQEDLLKQAKAAGKIAGDYRIPERHRRNNPDRLREALAPCERAGRLPLYPFGSDLTDTEIALGRALRTLPDELSGLGPKLALALAMLGKLFPPDRALPYLERMALDRPRSLREKLLQMLVAARLKQKGAY
ncbi:MAG: acetyl-CoA hydrolase/transferase C-terminal domain-containing protein [Alphaproteobacteria bacterium]